MKIRPEALRRAYLEACEAELQAFKPGNVSVHSEGHDMTVEDFRRSARASAGPLCAPALPLGEKIFRAVEATREAAGCNTNLGIVLLAAPLLQACLAGEPGRPVREDLEAVLQGTSREDADWVYRAIRLAAPGGLGEAESQDVREAPGVTLLEAMRLAAGRDRIAWQYCNSYSSVYELAIPRYHKALLLWHDEALAAVAVFAELLKTHADSHIERKFGSRFNRFLAEQITRVDHALSVPGEPESVLRLLREVDGGLKAAGLNPGTTADLTVACLLAARLEALV